MRGWVVETYYVPRTPFKRFNILFVHLIVESFLTVFFVLVQLKPLPSCLFSFHRLWESKVPNPACTMTPNRQRWSTMLPSRLWPRSSTRQDWEPGSRSLSNRTSSHSSPEWIVFVEIEWLCCSKMCMVVVTGGRGGSDEDTTPTSCFDLICSVFWMMLAKPLFPLLITPLLTVRHWIWLNFVWLFFSMTHCKGLFSVIVRVNRMIVDVLLV